MDSNPYLLVYIWDRLLLDDPPTRPGAQIAARVESAQLTSTPSDYGVKWVHMETMER